MADIDKNAVAEAAEEQEEVKEAGLSDENTDSEEEKAGNTNSDSKFAVAFDKGKQFMTRHGNIWQVVKFTLISLIAFLAEFATMYALQYGLADVCGQDFHWFVFHYTEKAGGQAAFIAMLGSKCIAEIISFTINRKKTFNANNNVAFSAIMYVITVVALVVFSTWLAGVINSSLGDHDIDAGLSSTISKMVGSIISFVVIFLMDKFVIMRKVKGKDDAEEKGAAETAENGEDGEGAEVLVADAAGESLVADAAAEVEIGSAADRE